MKKKKKDYAVVVAWGSDSEESVNEDTHKTALMTISDSDMDE